MFRAFPATLASGLLVLCLATNALPAAEGAAPLVDGPATLRAAAVNGVVLHYVDRGSGEPVIFVHGGLGDYRELDDVASALLPHYRVITYSRRYDSPNRNARRKGYSASIDAEDLVALIRNLKLGPVHLVGASYGAYGSILVALHHPELVRSLSLAEPPLIGWLRSTAAGKEALADFQNRLWKPMRRAAAAGDDARLLQVTVAFFSGQEAAANISSELRSLLTPNILEFRMLAASDDPFPTVSRARIRRLRTPVLLISGEQSYPGAKLIDPQLERAFPHARRVIVDGADHNVCTEKPAECASAVQAFLHEIRP